MRIGTKGPIWHLDAAGVAACAVIAAGWYMGGVAPLRDAKQARLTLETELADHTSQQKQLLETKRRQEEQLLSLRDKIEKAATRLEPAAVINSRIRQLTELAESFGLRLDEVRPGDIATLEHYTGVPIRIAGQGSYEQVARFLHGLHHTFKDIGVTGLDLRGEPEAPDKPPTFAVQLLWYASPQAVQKK
jgi:Tfp pilus assembly protein PilO